MRPFPPSLWHDTLPASERSLVRPALAGDADVDVAIVGGGFTGLWTAHSLQQLDPTRSILVIERDAVGYGASGRNGGWASALLPMEADAIGARSSRADAIAMQRAMNDAVAEIGRVCVADGIDADFVQGGTMSAATNPAHVGRLHAQLAHAHQWGQTEADVRWLDRREAGSMINAAGLLGALYSPHCAAVHPAKLVRGLARVVESRGARIVEDTAATAIEPGRVLTERGTVRAGTIIRATEGFTPSLKGHRRTVVPLYSLMVATEPLPEAVWDELGWSSRATFSDGRHLIIYAQRTADGRIAFGGRGAPYHFGSRVDPSFDADPAVHADIAATIAELFPAAAPYAITHRWGGPLAAARDWWCSVGFDASTGLGWAGGYVGDGVTTTNLAGRTLAHLITGTDSDLTRLPWVGHHSRKWEPEPLRWLGINAGLRLPGGADRHEQRTGRPERVRTWLLDRLLG